MQKRMKELSAEIYFKAAGGMEGEIKGERKKNREREELRAPFIFL